MRAYNKNSKSDNNQKIIERVNNNEFDLVEVYDKFDMPFSKHPFLKIFRYGNKAEIQVDVRGKDGDDSPDGRFEEKYSRKFSEGVVYRIIKEKVIARMRMMRQEYKRRQGLTSLPHKSKL